MRDWDAARYDRVSDPQVEWGRRVMLRLAPRAGERILDLGDPWLFASPDPTREALENAGFTAIETWLEEAPASFADAAAYSEFVRSVCLRHHLERLPPDRHGPFVAELARAAASDDPPFTLDYWRLNIDARRPAA